jgi:hypothetical protein
MGKLVDFSLNRVKQYSKALSQNGKMRTAFGVAQAQAMVTQAAKNMELLTGGKDSVAEGIRAFSQNAVNAGKVKQFSATETTMPAFADVGQTGLSSVQSLQTVSAIDITLKVLIYSFLPWMAIERPMDSSTTTISWKTVVATNSMGGVSKGDTLLGNFGPENSAMDLYTPIKKLSQDGAGAVLVFDFGAQLYEGTILFTITKDGNTLTGKDYNGVIAFPGDTTSFTVDYENGVVTSAAAVSADYSVTGQAMIDMWASSTNPQVLRGTTKMRSVQMVSRETGIVMEDSIDRIMFILKTLDQAGDQLSYEQYMSQMMFDLYLAFINNLLMIGIHTRSEQLEGTAELDELTVDLSTYGSQIIADPARKYDELSTLTENMNGHMLATANVGVTAWVVGSKICKLMAADKFRFKKSDTYNTQMNTLAGSYDGIPVLRHEYIDRLIDGVDEEGYGNIFGVYRDPNGEAAFMAYGEFLPIHTTGNVYNFANPLEFAKALVSQVGTKIIEEKLCVRGKFKVTA